jgi:hypothetical protein
MRIHADPDPDNIFKTTFLIFILFMPNYLLSFGGVFASMFALFRPPGSNKDPVPDPKH